jgi:AcrR family transcriptional regulator
MSHRTRERKAPEERRAQILDAAAGLFSDRPVEDVSMAQIAQRAGVAKGLPYHYFDSKDELLAALRERYLSEWYEVAEAWLLRPPGREWHRLEGFVRALYEFFIDRTDLHHVLWGDDAESEMFAHGRKLLSGFVGGGVERGVFEARILEATVEFVLHGLHGLLVRYVHDQRPVTQFAADALGVLDGLLRPARAR